MEESIKQLIGGAKRILITSHISPDPDAVSSVLLLMSTLELNFPDKNIRVVLEEQPTDLEFIEAYQKLVFSPLVDEFESYKPDLFILLDGNNYERASRYDGPKIRDLIRTKDIKTIIIDHHQEQGKDSTDIFINNFSPSTVQDVYDICFDQLGLKKPLAAAQTAMTGFYADTGGFVYVKAGQPDKVFGFAEKLVRQGADIEQVKYHLESYTQADIKVIGELAHNINYQDDYNYSYISDDFITKWLSEGRDHSEFQRGTNSFLNSYIRSIDGRSWGFIVYKNVLEGDKIYSASFRSQAGQPDVSLIAGKLGGGGHKPAAGARFEAKSVQDAIKIVTAAVAELAANA